MSTKNLSISEIIKVVKRLEQQRDYWHKLYLAIREFHERGCSVKIVEASGFTHVVVNLPDHVIEAIEGWAFDFYKRYDDIIKVVESSVNGGDLETLKFVQV